MKKVIFVCLFAPLSLAMSAQTEVLVRHKSTVEPPKPVVYDATNIPQGSTKDLEAQKRRAAAVAKVQGAMPTPVPATTTAKGLSPAMYSTGEDLTPVAYSAPPNPATTVTVNGQNVERNVRKGRGQVGDRIFTPVSELHFVQFAVYCKNTPVDKAPAIEGLYLIWHPGSKCPGGDPGASYIVKGYPTPPEAKAAVLQYKALGYDCWYNPALTGAEVEIIGAR